MSNKTYWIIFDWNAVGSWDFNTHKLKLSHEFKVHPNSHNTSPNVHIAIDTTSNPVDIIRFLHGVTYTQFLQNRFWILDKDYFIPHLEISKNISSHLIDLSTVRYLNCEKYYSLTWEEIIKYKKNLNVWYSKVKSKYNPYYTPLYLVSEDLLRFYDISNESSSNLNPLKR